MYAKTISIIINQKNTIQINTITLTQKYKYTHKKTHKHKKTNPHQYTYKMDIVKDTKNGDFII